MPLNCQTGVNEVIGPLQCGGASRNENRVSRGRLDPHKGAATKMTSGRHIAVSVALAAALAIGVGGCATQTSKHGHHFSAAEIQQVQPGMSKEQVQLTLGTPDTTATIDGGAYYYIASTTKGAPFMEAKEVDRKVVVVYFNPTGSVDRVAHYGMKDGKVFDFINRETPTQGGDTSIVKELFRNLGQGNPFDSN